MDIILSIIMMLFGIIIGMCIFAAARSPKKIIDEKMLMIAEIGIKTKDIINERNYFDLNRDVTHLGEHIYYFVYLNGDNYYVSISGEEVYKFIKVRNELYYLGIVPSGVIRQDWEIWGSENFFYEAEYQPAYDTTAGFSYESEFNYMFFADTLKEDIDKCYQNSNIRSYTLYIKNKYTWDKSNHAEDGQRIGVIVKYDDGDILDTYAYQDADGWHLSMPGYRTRLEQNHKFEFIFNRYVNSALYVTASIKPFSTPTVAALSPDPELAKLIRLSETRHSLLN